MDRLLTRTRQFIFAKQTSMISSTLIISAMFIVARAFGFLRYRVLAGYFVKEQLDVFYAAFRMPDLVFEILITGALTTSFIPFYMKYRHNKELHSEQISSIINAITLSLVIFIIIFTLLLPHVMFLITPGFSKEKNDQIIYFSQILLISQLPFLTLGNFLTGISQAHKMFLVPAIAPILYNIPIIIMTFFFAPTLGLSAPLIGVVLGAFLFFMIQLPILFWSDFSYLVVIKRTKELVDFFKMTIPRIFTVIVSQIDATIDLSLASLLGAGSYTVFYLGQHLQLLPVSVIGIAFSQASLPYLSEMQKENNMDGFRKVIVESVLNLFFFSIPITSLLIFARTPIVRLFFGAEKFDWDATRLTALTLSYFALSLPFHTIYYFITRCFYALFDSRTPFYVSLITIFINTILSLTFILVYHLPVWSLAVSFSTAMIMNTIILFFILHARLQKLDLHGLFVETSKIIGATILSSLPVYYFIKLFDNLILDTSRTINVFFLMSLAAVLYFLLYLFLSWIFNIRQVYLIGRMIMKAKEYQKKVLEIYTGI
ncbi:MAG: murein biosynthesis integral membrane protein MurJ [bacterium]|nr:murein biosynthesis integral membrane protein MurJ [bacterium]